MSGFARRSVPAALAALGALALTEHVLELRDTARLTTDDTFCSVRGKRVRYRLAGAGEPGPTFVLAAGRGAPREQWHNVQDPLARVAPVLAYDRGGMGFSDASGAQDASDEADELEGTLRAAHLPAPFVVVAYSASTLMMRIFVARHPDAVKAVVLLDPFLPEGDYPSVRVFAWKLVASLLGFMRLKGQIWDRPVTTRSEEKDRAITVSFHHWYATAREGVKLGDPTRRLLAEPAFGPIPLGVLCSFDPDRDPRNVEVVARSRALAAESPRGVFREARVEHTQLVTEPAGAAVVIDFVRTIDDQARASEPHGGQP